MSQHDTLESKLDELYKYLNECAREKLRESGKLLNKDNPNPSVIEI